MCTILAPISISPPVLGASVLYEEIQTGRAQLDRLLLRFSVGARRAATRAVTA